MPRLRPSLLLCFLTTSLAIGSTVAAQDRLEQADALLTTYHDYGLFDGSVLVASGDEVVYERGFGEADRSWGIPNAPDTRFLIGSITKQFTAALVLQLAEEGALDLDAPVTRYLPDYPAAQGDRVTIHHLLSHTSGVPEHTNRPDFPDMMRDPVAPDSFLAVFSGQPLDFEPGSAFRYSNSGYYLLGVIIEHVTGQTYAEALRQRLLAPLGLTDTGYADGRTVIDRMATGYDRAGQGVQHAAYFDASLPYAAGMMYSTVRDLFRWTRALHRGDPFEDAATLERMTTPVLNNYAYGLSNGPFPVGDRMVQAIGHDGGIPGFNSMLVYFPESDQTLALISNTADGAGPLARNVARVLHGQPAEEVRQPIGGVLAEVIEAEGIDAAVARYRAMREEGAADFDEDQLNALGYLYLERGETETAVRLFELNAETYPEASNPHDSLGEAYLARAASGDEARAIASYRRSLELDPTNDNARGVLSRFGVEVEEAAVTVSPEALASYVGRYAVAPSFVIEVTREGDRLFAQATGQPRFELFPVSETRFYLKEVEAQVSFGRGGDGPAGSLTLHQGGRDTPAQRVE